MQRVIASFADELVKLGKEDDHKHATGGYARSALIGALATPLVGLAANVAGRAMRNRTLAKMVSPSKFEKLKELGPLIGHAPPVHLPGRTLRPAMAYDDLVSKAVSGGLTGSAVQAVRDSLSKKEQAAQ